MRTARRQSSPEKRAPVLRTATRYTLTVTENAKGRSGIFMPAAIKRKAKHSASAHPSSIMLPKLFTTLKNGYTWKNFFTDSISGLTVAVVALPLAMAIAIASGATPAQGLVTAIIGGFLVSMLGGSRYQIGGPTAAFIVVVLNVILDHGYDGMLLATLIAGVLLIIGGFLRLGTYVKYVPYPVITGFTAGIAATIMIGQLKALFGFNLSDLGTPPRDFVHLVHAYATHINTISWPTLAIGFGSLVLMLVVRRYRPRWPVFLMGTVAGSLAIWASPYFGRPLDQEVATLANSFGALPNSLPSPELPDFSWKKVQEVLPSALIIAFLAGVEALLSAVVADGMTGRHHRSNIELVAQGTANCASVCFGGLPVTGAIARTATNIRAGALSPVSGMMHAVFLLVFMLVAAPLAQWIPLASLAAILLIVAWNISETERFRHLLRAPAGDRAVLLITFFLTVFIDLTAAIAAGVIIAAFLFMHRMAEMVDIKTNTNPLADKGEETLNDTSTPLPSRDSLPEGVETYRVYGPFFFGAASRINSILNDMRTPPKCLIIQMRDVPMMDASGVASLVGVFDKIRKNGGRIILSGVQAQPRYILRNMNVHNGKDGILMVPTFARALELARDAKA